MEFYNNKQTIALLVFYLLSILPLITIVFLFLAFVYISSLNKIRLKNCIYKIKKIYHFLMHKIKVIYQTFIEDIIQALAFNSTFLLVLLITLEYIAIDPREIKNIIEVCIPFIAAIIGLSIPFGVEMINKINEKYNSATLVESFQSENAYKSFFAAILFCIASSVLWILSEHFDGLNNTVLFLPHKLLLASTLLLFFCLFWFMYLIMLYYQPIKLSIRYEKFINRDMRNEKYFSNMKDLTVYSLNNIDDKCNLIYSIFGQLKHDIIIKRQTTILSSFAILFMK